MTLMNQNCLALCSGNSERSLNFLPGFRGRFAVGVKRKQRKESEGRKGKERREVEDRSGKRDDRTGQICSITSGDRAPCLLAGGLCCCRRLYVAVVSVINDA